MNTPYHSLTGCSDPDCTYSTCVNARAANKLIAAAPDMAEALRAAIDHTVACNREHSEWVATARAALAKAGL